MGIFFSVLFALGVTVYVIQMLTKSHEENAQLNRESSGQVDHQLHSATQRTGSKRSTILPLKSQKQDILKLKYCEEKHFDNVDQAAIVIGGHEGLEIRGYRGETLSLSEKVLVELDEGYAATTVISDLLIESYRGTIPEKKKIADLLNKFEALNDVTERDIYAIESAWETIADRLEGIDLRYKEISLAILENQKMYLRDGMFSLNGDEWRAVLSADMESIFEESKGDPLGVITQSLEDAESLLSDAELVLQRIDTDRKFFKNWLTEQQPALEKRGISDRWVISGLRDVEYDLFRPKAGYLESLKFNVNQILELSDSLEHLRSESGDNLLEMLDAAEQNVSKRCEIDQGVVFHNADFEKEVAIVEEILDLYQEALQQGDVDYASRCEAKASARVSSLKNRIEQTQEAALKGKQLHAELSDLYDERCLKIDMELKAFKAILRHAPSSVFQQDVISYIEQAEEAKKDLAQRLDKVDLELEAGKFVNAIASIEHIEFKLEHMHKTTKYLQKAREEIKEMSLSNERLLASVKVRFEEFREKKNHVYVSVASGKLFSEIEGYLKSADKLLETINAEKKQVDPRELATKIYRLQMTLGNLEDSLEEDRELHDFLQKKVVEIDETTEKVRANLAQVKSDGIEDSKLTKELVKSLNGMLRGWSKLKDKLSDTDQDTSELRFEYDVYFHGIESINIRLEQDLNLAEEASQMTREVSEQLHRVSAWRGMNGMRVELVECSRIVHHGLRALNAGDYKEAIVQSTYAKNEITRELHSANKQDVDTQMKISKMRSRLLGGEYHDDLDTSSVAELIHDK